MFTAEGGRGSLPLSAARMTTALKGHLRAAGLPSHFTMHSFRVGGSLSKSLAGTCIMKIRGLKTEPVAKHYIGATCSEKVHGSKRKRDQSYASASELPLPPEFQEDFAACARKIDQMLSLGETTLRLTSGQLRRQSNGTMKYGRDHGPALEASFNPTHT